MIKFLLFALVSTSAFSNEYRSLDKLSTQMRKDLRKSVRCLPTKTKSGGVKFCTGFSFNKAELSSLESMSFNSCKRKIKKKFGFTLSQEVQPRQIKEEEYSRFMHSTKRAQVYYPEKLVLLKQGTGRIDCIHELMHLYQYFSKNTSELSIKAREKLDNKVIIELEKHIKRVSLLEKRKKINEAQKIGKRLQPYIKLLGRYKAQSSWLHEKEIYYFLYKNCESFECTVLDKDIALANLYSLRRYFPWRVRDWLISESAKLIKQKEKAVFQKLAKNWKPIKKVDKKVISALVDTNLSDLRAKLKEDKVFFIKNSLFKEGVICDKGDLVILHKGELDHSLLVAATLRKDQLKKNPELCAHWPDTRVISKKFNQGIITREDYESTVLKSKMAKVLSDLDVYGILFKYQKIFPTDETSLILERWLMAMTSATFTVWENKLPNVFEAGMKFRFNEVNDLPMVYVNSRKLVLDLGAMDSVIRPMALSTEQLSSMIILEAKTLATAEGRRQSAPKVMLTTPMVQGAHKLMSTRWVLADLKIIGVEGTMGLNNFFGSEFNIIPRKRIVEFKKFKKAPKNSLKLQANYKGEYDAIEIICPEGHIVRVDTGSQVRGDFKPEGLEKFYKNKKLRCGPVNFKGPFEEIISEGPIFSRGVVLNIGWPLLREFKKVSVSLDKGWISFEGP